MRADRRTLRQRRSRVSLVQWEGIHQPRQRDAAEEQAAEDEQKKSDAFPSRVLPQQREVPAGEDGVDEHEDDVVAEQAHSLRPSAMSNASSIRSRFMRPAVMVNAVPCS